MAQIYYDGDIRTEDEWAAIHGVKATVIRDRLEQAYAGKALFIPPRKWAQLKALRAAQAKNQYETQILKMLDKDIPQFRFDIMVELAQKIGMKAFRRCEVKKQVNKGNWTYATTERGLLSFYGPGDTPQWDWMLRAADWVRRWQDPTASK